MREGHDPIIRPLLTLHNAWKSYGRTEAVRGVSFQMEAGERVGLLGPNGAGKTTCLKMIAGLLKIDGGSVKVLGMDLTNQAVEVKRVIGYIPEEPALFPYLTGREHLRLSRSLRRLGKKEHSERESDLIGQLELQKVMDHPTARYSHGMRQKLAFLLALYHDPHLLLVDEPLVGLDVYAQSVVKELMIEFSAREKAVLISTHTISLITEIASRVIILHRGTIAASGRPGELTRDADLHSFFRELKKEQG